MAVCQLCNERYSPVSKTRTCRPCQDLRVANAAREGSMAAEAAGADMLMVSSCAGGVSLSRGGAARRNHRATRDEMGVVASGRE